MPIRNAAYGIWRQLGTEVKRGYSLGEMACWTERKDNRAGHSAWNYYNEFRRQDSGFHIIPAAVELPSVLRQGTHSQIVWRNRQMPIGPQLVAPASLQQIGVSS